MSSKVKRSWADYALVAAIFGGLTTWMVTLFWAAIAWGQEATATPVPVPAPAEDLTIKLVEALFQGNWQVVGLAAVGLAFWALRKYYKPIQAWFWAPAHPTRRKWFGWVTALTTSLGYVAAVGLTQGPSDWIRLVVTGLTLGMAQVGIYELIIKPLLGGAPAKKVEPGPIRPVPDPEA